MRTYILLYNSGTDNEGIHTIQIGDQDFVLIFESEDDAIRYALLLEAQDFPTPSVEPIDREEVEDFCLSSGYEWKFISEGMLEIPPENNVPQTDWNEDGVYSPSSSEYSEAEMSAFELERIRRQLEGLL
ncbi:DUF3110 domain-containing protein [Geminocystis sp. GBBB08]|uniref:DUF3110 domain-containing protein n=1 Tax=Geminocystis sp. GBBB08 TaxID=2604140 RepID=UPI0027E254DE|nr:DUF3110 domain-containing protein [Geminocystis sp. GBBB08]MBL1209313.1 DUF3110 domain-containing protein [Geminocystis sp. GBBB08]